MSIYTKFREAIMYVKFFCFPGGFHGFRRSHRTITSHGEGLDNDQLDSNIAVIMILDIPYQS